MPSRLPASLALVGAGKMGSALLEGWLKLGLKPAAISAIDPGLDKTGRARIAALGIRHYAAAKEVGAVQAVVLAIKPQILDEVAPGLVPLFGLETMLLSVLAGKRISDLAGRLPAARMIVRCMPNTPAAVGRGITAIFACPDVDAARRQMAEALLSAVGRVEWLVEEGQIDAVTAVSGSGPAYVFHLVEAMAAAGEAAGLPADLAMRLARATVEGAGELLYRSDDAAATLRQNVTSPGGTTAAALAELMHPKYGLPPLMVRAVAAAKRRAEQLSG
jgi:pyrroline-5-carboxylate reductase